MVIKLGFNPLHCGAVVTSVGFPHPGDSVSIPFQSPSLRGSGHFRSSDLQIRPPRGGFQSPSLRGSGHFEGHMEMIKLAAGCFNPLHCGAVVTS